MPNKLNNGASVVSYGDTIPICATASYEFAKNANPGEWYAFVRSWFFTQFEDCRDLRMFIVEEDGTTTMKKVPNPKAA